MAMIRRPSNSSRHNIGVKGDSVAGTLLFLCLAAIATPVPRAHAVTVLADFETPDEVRITEADGSAERGVGYVTNTCATSGSNSFWLGPWRDENPREDFAYGVVSWNDASKRDWTSANRLVFDVTNLSRDEHALVFYVFDSAYKKRQNARYSFTMPPTSTRQIVADIDWKKFDATCNDVRGIGFVFCSPVFGAICIDNIRLLTPDDPLPAAPQAKVFKAIADGYTPYEDAQHKKLVKLEDAREAARIKQFRQTLDAELPVQAENLMAFKRKLSAQGHNVTDMIVAQTTAMEQIRPRGTDFSRLKPATGFSLRLARGEYESAYVAVASSTRKPLKNVTVAAEGAATQALKVQVEPIGYVLASAPLRHGFGYCVPCATNACGYLRKVKETPLGWYADPIMPFLKSVTVKPGDVQSYIVRVQAPESAAPGVYDGLVRIKADGAADRVVPFKVRVNKFIVGKTSALPLLVTFTPFVQPLSLSWTKEQTDAVRNDPEAPINLWLRHREEWSDFLGEYFLLPTTIYPKRGDTVPDMDLIKRAASRGRVGTFIVAPWASCKGNDEARFRATYVEPLKKRYAEACAAGLGQYVMAYGCDETEPEFFPSVKKAVEILKREVPNVPLITTAVDADLGVNSPIGGIDVFCPLTSRWKPDKVAASRKAGHKVWWYVACGEAAPLANLFVENPLSEGRILMGAQAFREKPDGFLYYAIAKWNQKRPILNGPYTRWSPHGIRHRNHKALDGDGVWTYCGPDGIPVSTLRLENFRDGVEDYNYAHILEGLYAAHADKDDAWAREAKKMLDVPLSVMESLTNFTDDPQVVYAWRDRMADLIDEATR